MTSGSVSLRRVGSLATVADVFRAAFSAACRTLLVLASTDPATDLAIREAGDGGLSDLADDFDSGAEVVTPKS
jgi:hypothetical protein